MTSTGVRRPPLRWPSWPLSVDPACCWCSGITFVLCAPSPWRTTRPPSQQACAISPAGALADYAPHSLWCLLDVVEAAVRTGRQEAARAHVDAMRRAEVGRISSRLAMLTAGTAALSVEDDSQAKEMFLHAMDVPEGRRWPFDRARIQLAFGERLRRQRDPELARAVLLEALDTFEQLSAKPWVRRTSLQLRAAGVPSRPTDRQPGAAVLTGAEYRVAQLAASGLTNRQIGEQLFLSHRTIGAILYRIFPEARGHVPSRPARRATRPGGPGRRMTLELAVVVR